MRVVIIYVDGSKDIFEDVISARRGDVSGADGVWDTFLIAQKWCENEIFLREIRRMCIIKDDK